MQAWQAALSTWHAFLAAVLPPSVHTDTATSAFLAAVLLPAVHTDTATSAFLAEGPFSAVQADTATSAFLAEGPISAVQADTATSAFLAHGPFSAVQADTATAAILAPAPQLAVRTDLTSAAFLASVRLPAVLATAATVLGHLALDRRTLPLRLRGFLALSRCCDRCLLLCNELLGPVRLEVLGIQCRIFFVRRFELPRPAGHTRAVTTRCQ